MEDQDKKRFLYAYHDLLCAADRAENKPQSLLLHCCCAPCSSAMLEELAAHFRLSVFYYNPNIAPEDEYQHRLAEEKRLLRLLPAEVSLFPCAYEPERFEAFAAALSEEPEGGKRCVACFALRLNETARAAKENGFDWFATTLTLSPMKDAALLNRIGLAAEEKYGVRYLVSDFKKEGGYLRSIRQSERYGLYRQNYCGCLYSKAAAEKRQREKETEKTAGVME